MRRFVLTCSAVLTFLMAAGAADAQSARQLLNDAVQDFGAGRIEASIDGFDAVIAADPDAMPYLWQRGIALYYAERWDDCIAQFEAHRTVNPNDVENAAWHYLCVARKESPEAATAQLLPVGPDARVPMDRVYALYRGDIEPEAVLAAAGESLSGRFYANLYVGLYYEVVGQSDMAATYMAAAAEPQYDSRGNYMHMVARVHQALRGQ